MLTIHAVGDVCPVPVLKARKVIRELTEPETVEVLVDNKVAVQNLTKLAGAEGCEARSEKIEEKLFRVLIMVGKDTISRRIKDGKINSEKEGRGKTDPGNTERKAEDACQECIPDARGNVLVVVSSGKMGEGSEELGKILMKGFLYALTQLEELPSAVLFYNGGVFLTCEGSPALEDLKSLEAQGVEILSCGTCLNYYGLTEKLQVGGVTNMYVIAEKMTKAERIVKP